MFQSFCFLAALFYQMKQLTKMKQRLVSSKSNKGFSDLSLHLAYYYYYYFCTESSFENVPSILREERTAKGWIKQTDPKYYNTKQPVKNTSNFKTMPLRYFFNFLEKRKRLAAQNNQNS